MKIINVIHFGSISSFYVHQLILAEKISNEGGMIWKIKIKCGP